MFTLQGRASVNIGVFFGPEGFDSSRSQYELQPKEKEGLRPPERVFGRKVDPGEKGLPPEPSQAAKAQEAQKTLEGLSVVFPGGNKDEFHQSSESIAIAPTLPPDSSEVVDKNIELGNLRTQHENAERDFQATSANLRVKKENLETVKAFIQETKSAEQDMADRLFSEFVVKTQALSPERKNLIGFITESIHGENSKKEFQEKVADWGIQIQEIQNSILRPYISKPENKQLVVDFVASKKEQLKLLIIDSGFQEELNKTTPDHDVLLKNDAFVSLIVNQKKDEIFISVNEQDKNDYNVLHTLGDISTQIASKQEYVADLESQQVVAEKEKQEAQERVNQSEQKVTQLSQEVQTKSGELEQVKQKYEKEQVQYDAKNSQQMIDTASNIEKGKSVRVTQETSGGPLQYDISRSKEGENTYYVKFDEKSFQVRGDDWKNQLAVITTVRTTPGLQSVFNGPSGIFDEMKSSFGQQNEGKGLNNPLYFAKFLYEKLSSFGEVPPDLIDLKGLEPERVGLKILSRLQDPEIARVFMTSLRDRGIVDDAGNMHLEKIQALLKESNPPSVSS